MSNNLNTSAFPSGEFAYGENNYWHENQFSTFDSDFQASPEHESHAQGSSQGWSYAPNSFDVAGPAEHHSAPPYTWNDNHNNNVDDQYFSNDVSHNQYGSPYASTAQRSTGQLPEHAYRTATTNQPSFGESFSQGFPANPQFAASSCGFDNEISSKQPLQASAIAPQALQLSDSAKASVSREVSKANAFTATLANRDAVYTYESDECLK